MNNTELNTFPALPDFHVNWAPVHMEPIMGSGEKFTIAIAAIDEGGIPTVLPVLDFKRTQCLLGKRAKDFSSIVNLCIDSLKDYVSLVGKMDEWSAPLEGISLGPTRLMHSISLESAMQLIIQKSAFLGDSEIMFNEELEDDERKPSQDDPWQMQIKESMKKLHPEFLNNFKRKFRVTPDSRETAIDFLGIRYAANFGRLLPGNKDLLRTLKETKVKLWDIASLKDYGKEKGSLENRFGKDFQLHAFELILWKPSPNNPAYGEKDFKNLHEAFNEIKYEGEAKKITVRDFTGEGQSDRAASKIAEMEAA